MDQSPLAEWNFRAYHEASSDEVTLIVRISVYDVNQVITGFILAELR